MQTTSAAVIIAISLVVFGISYYHFTTRHRERMAIIENGSSPDILKGAASYLPLLLALGMVCIGIALGIVAGAWFSSLDFPGAGYALPVAIFLFTGISLILSYYLVRKLTRPKTSCRALLFAFVMLSFASDCRCQQPAVFFDSLLTAQFPASAPGAVAMAAKDGRIIYKKAFGMASLELGLPMRTDNVFRIGSNTKQFTAMAILKLAEEGRLSLHDDITKYITYCPAQGHSITIEALLTHTSGIKNYTGLPGFNDIKRKDLGPKELISLFKNAPMDFEPGGDFRYSNSGYILLGAIIEQVSGKTYGQFINDAFFQPLGMQHSFYDDPSIIIPGRIGGYRVSGGQYKNAEFLSMSIPYAAGSLLSTVDDLYTWYRALADGRVVSRQSLEKAQISFRLPGGRFTGYGYGWFTGNVQGSPSVKHDGAVNGFVTYAAYLPAEKIFVAIFSNSESAGDLDVPASKMIASLLGRPYQFTPVPLPAAKLETYQGIYNTSFDGQKIMACQDGHLVYYSRGGVKQELVPYGKDLFFIPGTLSGLRFERNAKGSLTGFTLSGTGLTVHGTITPEKIKATGPIPVDPKFLKSVAGKYQFDGFVLEIETDDDRLYGKVGNDRKELILFAPYKVYARDTDATLIFVTDTGGKVTGMTKIQNSVMEAVRIE